MPESIGLEAVMDMGAFNRSQSQYIGAVGKMGDETSKQANIISRAMAGVGGAVGKGMAAFGSIGLAINGVKALASTVTSTAKAFVAGNAEFEQYNVRFTTLLKSADAAKDRMKELAIFGAKTPFDLPGVVKADTILQGFGLHSAESAVKFGFAGAEIRTIAGDVASGTGASFEQMALLLGKFASGATGEAIMRFSEMGITTREEMGKLGIEFSKSGQMMSPLPEAMNIVLKLMKDKYGGLMDAQSATFEGMMSNLSDWQGNAKRVIMAPLFEVLKEKLAGLLTVLNSEAVMTGLERLASGMASALKVGLGAIESVVKGIKGLIGAFKEGVATVHSFSGGVSGVLRALDLDPKIVATLYSVSKAVERVVEGFRLAKRDLPLGAGAAVEQILLGLGLSPELAEKADQVVDAVIESITGFVANIRDIISFVGERGGTTGEGIGAFLSLMGLPENLTELLAIWIDRTISSITGFITNIQDIITFVTERGGTIEEGAGAFLRLLGFPEDITTTLISWTTSATEAISSAIETIKGAIFASSLAGAFGGESLVTFLRVLGLPVDIATEIGIWVDNVIATMQNIIPTIKKAVFASSLAGAFGASEGQSASVFLTMLGLPTDISNAVGDIIDDMVAALQEGIATLQGIFTGDVGILEGVFNINGTITQAKEDLIIGLAELGQTILDNIATAFPDTKPYIDTVFTPLLDTFKLVITTVNDMKAQLGPVFAELWEKAGPPLEKLAKDLFPALNAVIQAAIPIVGKIIEVASKIIADVLPVAIDLIDKIVVFIGEKMPQIQSIITKALDLIQAVWDKVWPAIQTTVEVVWDVLEAVISTALDIIEGIIKVAMDLVSGDWDKAWEDFKDLVSVAWDGIKKIIDELAKGIQTLADDLEKIFGGINETLETWKEDAIKKVKEFPQKAVEAIEKFADKFATAGENLIGGLIDGVKAKASELIEAAKKVVTGAIDAAKAAVGIHSHSTVAKEMGGDLMGGLTDGIKSEGRGVSDALLEVSEYFMLFAQSVTPAQAKTMKDVASAFKDMSKGVDELVGSFAKLYEMGEGGMLAGNTFPTLDQITAALDQFLAIADVLMVRIQGVIDAIGYDKIHKLRLTARRLADLISVLMIDLSPLTKKYIINFAIFDQLYQAFLHAAGLINRIRADYSDKMLADMEQVAGNLKGVMVVIEIDVSKVVPSKNPRWMSDLELLITQLQALVGAIVGWLGDMKASARAAIAQAAKNAALIKELYVVLISPADVIKPSTSKTWQADLTLTVTQIAALVTELTDWLGAITGDALDMLTNAGAAANAMKGVLDIIKPGVDALTAIGAYVSAALLPEALEQFENDLVMVARVLGRVATQMDYEALAAAVDIFEAAQKVLGIVKVAIDALAALGTYVAVVNLDGVAFTLSTQIETIVNMLVDVASHLDVEGIAAAAALGANMTTVINLVKPAVDALTALGTYIAVVNMDGVVFTLSTQIESLVVALADMASHLDIEGLQAASATYAAMKGIVDFVKPAIDMLTALAAYEETTDLMNQADRLANGLTAVIPSLQHAFDTYTSEGIPAASELYNAMKGIVDFVKPAIDMLTALAAYEETTDLMNQADRLANGLVAVIPSLQHAFDTYNAEGTAAASGFYNAAKGIIDFVKPGIDAIAALAAFAAVADLPKRVADFVANLLTVVDALKDVGDGYDADGLAAARLFGDAAKDIVGMVKPGIDALEALLKYESGDVVGALRLFHADFRTLVTGLANIAYDLLGSEGLDTAVEFKEVAEAIAATCKSGVEAIATLGAATEATGTDSILKAFADGVKAWLAAAVTNVKTELGLFRDAFVTELPAMVLATYNYGHAAGQAMIQGWRDATSAGFTLPSLPSGGGGSYPVAPSAVGSSVTVNFGGVNISNGMDQAAFENRVLQVVSAAVGR